MTQEAVEAPVEPKLPPRPTGKGWQGRTVVEQTPSGWWLRLTEMHAIGASHVELFGPDGKPVVASVVWAR